MLRLRAGLVDTFRRLDTGRVSNAIETFDVRLRNEGFADSTIRALFDDLPPVLGCAVTARVRSSVPPPVGHNYHDRTDWWNYILTLPAPRIVIVEESPRASSSAFPRPSSGCRRASREVIGLCQSPDFSVERLRALVKEMA